MFVACLLLTGCCTAHRSSAWEYKTIRIMVLSGNPDQELNAQLKDGWRVVSFSVTEPTSNVWNYHYLLRRPARQPARH
jgi:hypothetical protein